VDEILAETLARLGLDPNRRVSVKAWLSDWLEAKGQSVSATSLAAYSQAVREFLEFLGASGSKRSLESITERDIERFTARLVESGRSPVTINKLIRKYLSAPFQKALKTGKIRYNPVAGTSPLRTDSQPKGIFTPAQVVALLAVAHIDWQGAILFAYSTGARLGDVANLKWSDLDVANGIVVFREQKTGSRATLGLIPEFLDWLPRAADPAPGSGQGAADGPVFPTLAGRPLNGAHGLSASFTKLLDKAGIEKRLSRVGQGGKSRSVRALTFHSFRHTVATAVFNQAALREITRRVTNHAADGVLDRYIHQDLEAIRAATALIPRLPK
jgi:integrase